MLQEAMDLHDDPSEFNLVDWCDKLKQDLMENFKTCYLASKRMKIGVYYVFDRIKETWLEAQSLMSNHEGIQSVSLDPAAFLDEMRNNCNGDMATLTAVWMLEETLDEWDSSYVIDIAGWCDKIGNEIKGHSDQFLSLKVNKRIRKTLELIKQEWLNRQQIASENEPKNKLNKFTYQFKKGITRPYQIWLNSCFIQDCLTEEDCLYRLNQLNNALK